MVGEDILPPPPDAGLWISIPFLARKLIIAIFHFTAMPHFNKPCSTTELPPQWVLEGRGGLGPPTRLKSDIALFTQSLLYSQDVGRNDEF